jgi:hypothetical protein
MQESSENEELEKQDEEGTSSIENSMTQKRCIDSTTSWATPKVDFETTALRNEGHCCIWYTCTKNNNQIGINWNSDCFHFCHPLLPLDFLLRKNLKVWQIIFFSIKLPGYLYPLELQRCNKHSEGEWLERCGNWRQGLMTVSPFPAWRESETTVRLPWTTSEVISTLLLERSTRTVYASFTLNSCAEERVRNWRSEATSIMVSCVNFPFIVFCWTTNDYFVEWMRTWTESNQRKWRVKSSLESERQENKEDVKYLIGKDYACLSRKEQNHFPNKND